MFNKINIFFVHCTITDLKMYRRAEYFSTVVQIQKVRQYTTQNKQKKKNNKNASQASETKINLISVI